MARQDDSTTAPTSGSSKIEVLEAQGASEIVVAGEAFIQYAEYTRQGTDLLLTGRDGRQVLVEDYFLSDTPPDLVSDGGARVTGDIAVMLAGPQAPAQYAQAGPAAGGPPVIGKVAEVSGDVRVVKADGSTVVLSKDALVHQGDQIETGTGAKLGLVFIDKTTFAIGENARMVLNEVVFDPQGGNLSSVVTLLHGAFLFVTGEIGKLLPEAVVVNTPVATIGVRGTETSVLVNQILETLQVASERGPSEGIVTVTINNITHLLNPGTIAPNITPLTTQIDSVAGSLLNNPAFTGPNLPSTIDNIKSAIPPRSDRTDNSNQTPTEAAGKSVV